MPAGGASSTSPRRRRCIRPGPLNSAYGTAKVALNQFTRHLAPEIEGTGVTANVIHPGDVKTDMWRTSATGSR